MKMHGYSRVSSRHVLSATLFLLAISTGPVLAEPVPYTIDFGGTNAPTSGSFDYDSSTFTFTDFSVTWDSTVFNLTSSANDPIIVGTDPCLGGATGGLASFKLLTSCTGSDINTNTIWFGHLSPTEFQITDEFNAVTNWGCIETNTPGCITPYTVPGGLILGISQVPEPAYGSLVLVGIGLLLLIVQKRKAQALH